MDSEETIKALAMVLTERVRQIGIGYDAGHDETHVRTEWAELIEAYTARAVDASTLAEYRKSLAKIAALTIAALEVSHRPGAMRRRRYD